MPAKPVSVAVESVVQMLSQNKPVCLVASRRRRRITIQMMSPNTRVVTIRQFLAVDGMVISTYLMGRCLDLHIQTGEYDVPLARISDGEHSTPYECSVPEAVKRFIASYHPEGKACLRGVSSSVAFGLGSQPLEYIIRGMYKLTTSDEGEIGFPQVLNERILIYEAKETIKRPVRDLDRSKSEEPMLNIPFEPTLFEEARMIEAAPKPHDDEPSVNFDELPFFTLDGSPFCAFEYSELNDSFLPESIKVEDSPIRQSLKRSLSTECGMGDSQSTKKRQCEGAHLEIIRHDSSDDFIFPQDLCYEREFNYLGMT